MYINVTIISSLDIHNALVRKYVLLYMIAKFSLLVRLRLSIAVVLYFSEHTAIVMCIIVK